MPIKSKIQDQTFLFTGTLTEFTRDEAEELVAANGGKVLSGVSGKLNYLVVGEDAGSKLEKAKALGTVKILTEKEFLKMVPKGVQKPTGKAPGKKVAAKVAVKSAAKATSTQKDTSSADAIAEVKIGNQIWMAKNLDVTHFLNGELIPEAKTDKEWKQFGDQGKPAWCYYNNNHDNGIKFGKLYNWYAVNDSRGLAPFGWIVPTIEMFNDLINFYGEENKAWENIRSKDMSKKNGESFNGFLAGRRTPEGAFEFLDKLGLWWCSNQKSIGWSNYFYLEDEYKTAYCASESKSNGFSVRCLKSNSNENKITSKDIISNSETTNNLSENARPSNKIGLTENQVIEHNITFSNSFSEDLDSYFKENEQNILVFFDNGGIFSKNPERYFSADFYDLFNADVFYCIYNLNMNCYIQVNFSADPTDFIVDQSGRLNRNLFITIDKSEDGLVIELEREHFYDYDDVDDEKILKTIKKLAKEDKSNKKWKPFKVKRNPKLGFENFKNKFVRHFALEDLFL